MRLIWPAVRPRTVLWIVSGCIVIGLWQGSTALLALRAGGDATPWPEPFVWELTGALATCATLWIPLVAVLNAPRPTWSARSLGVHVVAFLAFATAKDALMIGARFALYPALGWGSYDYPAWRVHLAMELMKDAVSYAGIAIGYGLYRGWRDRQALALRESELAGELKEARLQALLGQLNPHFLFNALNTVSALMYEDLDRTDRLLADLGDVLRASLDSDRVTWTCAEEQAHTERFFALLHARFGDRIRVRADVEPDAAAVPVPRFALQLLVENAVKHNRDRAAPLEVRISARRDGATLILEVEDDGRGFAAPSLAPGAGLGLRHLEQVLALLHGDAARLERGQGSRGGARVRLVLPVEAP